MKTIYIDTQNIHKGIQATGRIIDWELVYIYLCEKFSPQSIKMFVGYIPRLQDFYKKLETIGYSLIFKQTSQKLDGSVKGNVDVDLTMHVMDDLHTGGLGGAIIVSGDSDFNTLIMRLRDEKKLIRVIVPNIDKTSSLLRHAAGTNIQSLQDLSHRLAKDNFDTKKETPHTGVSPLGGRKQDSLSSGEHNDTTDLLGKIKFL